VKWCATHMNMKLPPDSLSEPDRHYQRVVRSQKRGHKPFLVFPFPCFIPLPVSFPAALRIDKSRDKPEMFSILNGPVLLAGALGRDNMPNDFADKDAHIKLPAAQVPDIVNGSVNPAGWMQPIEDDKGTFRMNNGGPANGIIFRPVFEVHHERFSVYWRCRQA
jgi:hypothetical protein